MFDTWKMPLMNMDGGGDGGGDNGGSTPAPAAPAAPAPGGPPQPDGINPLLDPNFGQPAPQMQMQTQQEMLDFAGRQVPVVDPVIRDLHRDYSHLQRSFQDQGQILRQMQEQNTFFMQQMQQQQMQPQAPPQPQGPTPEQMQEFSQQYMDRFYDDPIAANRMLMESPYMKDVIQKQVEQMVKQHVEPIQRERQYTQEIQQLSQRYPDFQQYVADMQAVIQQRPQLAEHGLETVYMYAKGQRAQSQPQLSPEQMLGDPNFRQMVVGNEDIRNQIVSQYMQQRQQSNQQVPPVIGNQPGGNPPAMPENRPTNLKEGTKMWLRNLGFNNNS